MRRKQFWIIAIGALILLTAAAGYAPAEEGSRAATQSAGEDAEDRVTFRVRIQNISADTDPPVLFAPGVWALHSEAGPIFTAGEADRGEGLETLAEDGDPRRLVKSLRAKGLQAGIFHTPVCADAPGLLPSGETVEFGNSYEFEVTASPETPYLSFAAMFVQSNDLFLAPAESGIALFDEDGKAIGAEEVTNRLRLWDAGTEANEEPGTGPNQVLRQPDANTGPADDTATVRPVDDGFSYPEAADLVKVSIIQVPMIEQDRGRQPAPEPDHSVGDEFRVGDIQWRVRTAEYLGHEVKNGKGGRLITDERFVLVRFEFLNLGSDPVKFDGGPGKGAPLRDNQGRAYPYYLVPDRFSRDDPPREYIPADEDCYGRWRLGQWWRPFELKPNTPTTCSIIYEVDVDAASPSFLASDLTAGQESAVDLNLPAVPVRSIGEYVRVGEVRWQVLAAEDLGHVLEANDKREKTRERFLAVRFQITNKSSADLKFHGAKLRDGQGREHERGRTGFIAENERCTDGIRLKPNAITTCASIYEVPVMSTGIIFIADDLGGSEDGAEMVDLGLSDVMPMPVRLGLSGEDVEVGDVCWHALSVQELGRELRNEDGDTATAEGRFVQTRFRLLNMGSETLEYDGVALMDSHNRVYRHFGERLEFIPDDEECPPSRILSSPYPLKPNAPTICTAIHDVEEDAKNFVLRASDFGRI